ncbi:MAG: choice-of-anchor D domain-containing protein [Deltaproteobacteria bacterium]|nr:choice-of-anchor D domain-containing protein [Deltaproteobacteria bacterium]
MTRSTRLVPLLLLATQACNCDDTLTDAPAPEIVVADEDGTEAGGQPPLIIEFGDVEIGQRVAHKVRIRNTGKAPLALTRAAPLVDPADTVCPVSSAEFAYPPLSSSQGVEVGPSGEKLIEVAYRPQDGGGDCAIMQILSNDGDEPETRVYFRARGSAARFCAQDPSLDFGDVVIGQQKDLPTKVTNCGIRTLTITAVRATSSFPPFELLTPVTTPRALQPGEEIPLDFRFAPVEARRYGGLGATADPGVLVFETTEAGVGSLTLLGRGVTPPECHLVVAPTAINFGQVAVGASATRDVLISNSGDAPCTVDSISRISGSTDFSVTAGAAPPAVTVAPAQVQAFTITLAPAAAGLLNAVFRVTSSTTGMDYDVNVEANQPPPQGCALEPDPAFLNFGTVPMGRVNSLPVVLRSVGTEDCSVKQITFPAGSPEFSTSTTVLPLIGLMVPSGESTNVNVDFRAASPGPRSGRMQIKYGELGFGGTTTTLNVDLAGNAQAPTLCVDPQELDFGSVPVGTEVRRSVSLQSCGATELTLRGVQIASGSSPAFDVPTPPALPATVQPGSAVTVEVRYKPTTAAGDLGILQVMSDDPNLAVAPVRLKGNAAGLCPPLMVCSPDTLEFGNVQVGFPQTMAVVCRNYGTQTVTVTSASIAPSPPWAQASMLPRSLAVGDALTVQVTLTPLTTGAYSGTLTVNSNACASAQQVQLTATGIPPLIPTCTPPASFTPREEWAWTTSTVHPQKDQVWMTPLVVNLTDDNGDGAVTAEDIPDVVFTSFDGRDFKTNPQDPDIMAPIKAVVRAVSGDDGRELWTAGAEEHMVQSEANLAAGDIDGDNLPEIIGSKYVLLPGESIIPDGPKVMGRFVRGRLICFDSRGGFKWESDEWTASKDEMEDSGAPAIADLDGDGFAEVIWRNHVFDAAGHLKWAGTARSGSAGHGAFSFPVDLNGDGTLEVSAGFTAYRADGSILWNRTDVQFDGLPAVADFEGDGTPEVVVTNGWVHILNGEDGTDAYPTITLPYPEGGCSEANASDCDTPIPTNVALADFDGDGKPEIAVANKNLLLVLEANGTENWRVEISDQSGMSGPSAFDFEGDGIYEVVYADEQQVFALRGTTGQNIYTSPRSSRTIAEYATIADVDNDGHANIVVVQNEPLLRQVKGIKMLANATGQWAGSSRIWNQHAYHITNVTESGQVPRAEPTHWRGDAAHNSFRAQGPRCQ